MWKKLDPEAGGTIKPALNYPGTARLRSVAPNQRVPLSHSHPTSEMPSGWESTGEGAPFLAGACCVLWSPGPCDQQLGAWLLPPPPHAQLQLRSLTRHHLRRCLLSHVHLKTQRSSTCGAPPDTTTASLPPASSRRLVVQSIGEL
uniref:Uncharacterized protein n=1 Tax=Oryza glumipatula TaxID=40148 RepID=A0A0E0B401_9ORYZ